MKQLFKHKLKFRDAFDYTKQNLEKTNKISSQTLKMISSRNGQFYTLLPNDAELNRIHEFNSGYLTSCIDKEISRHVTSLIIKKKCSCIFDDVNTRASDNYKDDFSVKHALSYKNEVYYTIKREKISEEIFFECMAASDGIWHSLCVITTFDLDEMIGKELDETMVEKICVNAQLVMIGAYDGEGYIFWEKDELPN